MKEMLWKKKRLLVILLVMSTIMMSLTACQQNSPVAKAEDVQSKTVGISMPTSDILRWKQDGNDMKDEMEKAGYQVNLQYANNNRALQVSQIEAMIAEECDILVVAPIYGRYIDLAVVLNKAKDANIPVISYDRLIMNTQAITYYVTFDHVEIGIMQGEYIVNALDLENSEGTYNIELFTGPKDDMSVNYFFGGAMSILQPYLDEGKLVVQSENPANISGSAVRGWSAERARERMSGILLQSYSDGAKVDAVLASTDSLAQGVTAALLEAGYTGADFPVITGQDSSLLSIQNISAGLQGMTVYQDSRKLVDRTVIMVDDYLKGLEVEVNDLQHYHNYVGIVPTFLCEPEMVDAGNYREVLISSGFYTEAELEIN